MPGSEEGGFWHDLFYKRLSMYDENNERQSDNDIYEKATKPKLIQMHEEFAIEMYEKSDTKVDFIWGGKSRKLMERKYSKQLKKVKGVGKYRMAWITDDKGERRLLVFLQHPEFMINRQHRNRNKFVHQETMTRVISLLYDVEAETRETFRDSERGRGRSFNIDIAALERVLTNNPEIREKIQTGKLRVPKDPPLGTYKNPTAEQIADVEPFLDLGLSQADKERLAKKHDKSTD